MYSKVATHAHPLPSFVKTYSTDYSAEGPSEDCANPEIKLLELMKPTRATTTSWASWDTSWTDKSIECKKYHQENM